MTRATLLPPPRFERYLADANVSIECTNTQLVSALNSDDTGTHNVANGLFSLPANFLQAVFGDSIGSFNSTKGSIPAVGSGSIYGDKACIARCRARGYKIYE